MLRRRRGLYRSFTLISLAMSLLIMGYFLEAQYTDHFVQTGLTDNSKLNRKNLRKPPILPDADKLARIAKLLQIDQNTGGEYKQIQNRILQIEDILERFRSGGKTNAFTKKLKSFMKTGIKHPATQNHKIILSQTTEYVNTTVKPQERDKKRDDSVLEHIEDLLEEPPFRPPPIKNVELNSKPFIKNLHYKPSTCVTNSKNSSWFNSRYLPNIKMFMDKEDVNNFTNYYKLSHYRLPFGIKGQDRRLMARLLNNPNFTNPNVFDDMRPQCVRCAVVGLGGVLNGSNMGDIIDRHDYVFRVNRALTEGRFAQDVGRRTSFYTFFPESQYAQEIHDPTFMSFYVLYRSYDIAYAMSMLANDTPPLHTYDGQTYWLPTKPKLDVNKLKIIHPDFMRYVFTRFLDSKGHRPTSGALVVFIALHLCDEVSMYGFGYDTRFPLHYYDNEPVNLNRASVGSHDVDNERRLWQRMMNENVLHFYTRPDEAPR